MAPLVALKRTAARQRQAYTKEGLGAPSSLIIRMKDPAGRPVVMCPKTETITMAMISTEVQQIGDASRLLQTRVSKFLSNICNVIRRIRLSGTKGRNKMAIRVITKMNEMQTIRSKREKFLTKRIKKLTYEAELVQMAIVKIGMRSEVSSQQLGVGKQIAGEAKCIHNFQEVLQYSMLLKHCIGTLHEYSTSIDNTMNEMKESAEILCNTFKPQKVSKLTSSRKINSPSCQNRPLPILKKIKRCRKSKSPIIKKTSKPSKAKRININIEHNTLRLIPLAVRTMVSGFRENEFDVHLDVTSYQHVQDLFSVPFGIRNN